MPYVLPSDLATRRLGQSFVLRHYAQRSLPYQLRGAYINQIFPLPVNSLNGNYRMDRVALGGGVVPEIITRPPFRSTMGGWIDDSTAGLPNKYLAIGAALLAVTMLTGGRRRRGR